MIPIEIELKDFMNHRESYIDCTLFDSVLIVGKNKNNERVSNGIGKTTIFNAIEYALFNSPPDNMTLDQVIHDGCGKCTVKFTFEIDNSTYKIIRSRSKRSDVQLYEKVDGEWVSRCEKTSKATDKAILEIVKFNVKTFRHSVLFAQNDLTGLASSTPEKRKGLLKEPLNISIYNKFLEIIKADIADLNNQIQPHQAIIDSFKNEEDSIKNAKDVIKLIDEQIKTLKQDIANYKAIVNTKREILSNLERSIDLNLNEELRNTETSIKQTKNKIKSLSELKESTEKNIKDVSSKLEKYKIELSERSQILTSVVSRKLRNSIDVEKDIEKAEIAMQKGYSYISVQKSKLEELISFSKNIKDIDQKCPTCRQTIGPEHKNNCFEEIQKESLTIKENIKKYNPKLEKIKLKLENFKTELFSVNETNNKLILLKEQIKNNSSLIKNNKKSLSQLEDTLKEVSSSLSKEEKSYNQLIKVKNNLLQKIEENSLDQILQNIENIKTEINGFDLKIEGIYNEINQKTATKAHNEQIILLSKQNVKRIKDAKSKISALEKKIKIQKRVAQAFSSSGIPAMIISTILDDLQSEANNLLSQIKPEIELQFSLEKEKADGTATETLDIYYRVSGKDRTYHQLSGAQKLLVALSLKLGLAHVIQQRLGVEIKFLALDEVDQSLDRASVDSLVDVIKQWQKRFKIFIITHNDDLKDRFAHAILVEGDTEHGSYAKVVTSW